MDVSANTHSARLTPAQSRLQGHRIDADERTQRELTRMLLVSGHSSGYAVILGAILISPVLLKPQLTSLYLYWLAYMSVFATVRMVAMRRYLAAGELVDWRKPLVGSSALTIVVSLGWMMLPLLRQVLCLFQIKRSGRHLFL